MNLATETLDPTTALIRPQGRLTMVSTASLRSLVAETVAAGHVHVVVDLSECEFIDSSGLGALVAGLKRPGRPAATCGSRVLPSRCAPSSS